jgi:hypothetical protein
MSTHEGDRDDMKSLIRRLTVLGAFLAVLLLGGIVFAAWVVTGTGSGYSKARTAAVLTTADVSATTSAQLYPGGQGDVKVRINNPNPFPVKVTQINPNGAIGSDLAGCTDVGGDPTKATGVTFTAQSLSSGNVVAGGGSLDLTLANAVSMDNTSVDACQGAVFSIPVSITAGT